MAPDVARGLALLGIAIANSAVHVSGVELGPGARPVDGSGLDRLVNGLVSLLVDRRTLPMFALLFGYGFVVVLRRQHAAGAPWGQARGRLLRRCLWLAVFGVAHVLLVWEGDILLLYALTGLALVPFLLRADRTLLAWAGGLLAPMALVYAVFAGLESALPQDDPGTVLGALAVRAAALVTYLVLAPVLVASTLTMMLLGAWAARRRLLEAPERHLPLLRRLVVVGFAVSIAGGLPYALVVARVLQPGPVLTGVLGGLHGVTGVAGGVAFAALVGLVVATRLAPSGRAARPPGVVRALRARERDTAAGRAG